MLPLQDIESELSYAYLHAIASEAGVACQQATRSHDNAGIDATLHLIRDFGEAAPLTEISVHIQLKATTKPPRPKDGRVSYQLESISDYDRLRRPRSNAPRLLAVLYLPKQRDQWLSITPEALVLHDAAYWVSLIGAPDSTNTSSQTVHLPQSQLLSPEGLLAVFGRLARREELRYGA